MHFYILYWFLYSINDADIAYKAPGKLWAMVWNSKQTTFQYRHVVKDEQKTGKTLKSCVIYKVHSQQFKKGIYFSNASDSEIVELPQPWKRWTVTTILIENVSQNVLLIY